VVPIIEDMLFKTAVTVLLTLPVPAPPAPEWPQDGYGPGNTGWNPAETAVGAATIGELKPAWTATIAPAPPAGTGKAPDQARQARPAHTGPVRTVAVDDRRIYASLSGSVRAYSPATGRSLWSRKVTAPGRPVRAHDLLYVHTGDAVAILNPATGVTVALSAPFRPMSDHVVVAGGRLYVTDTSSIRTYATDHL
jgi:outer membrane protein assembly factor BamB